jgi:hypothetical protein
MKQKDGDNYFNLETYTMCRCKHVEYFSYAQPSAVIVAAVSVG